MQTQTVLITKQHNLKQTERIGMAKRKTTAFAVHTPDLSSVNKESVQQREEFSQEEEETMWMVPGGDIFILTHDSLSPFQDVDTPKQNRNPPNKASPPHSAESMRKTRGVTQQPMVTASPATPTPTSSSWEMRTPDLNEEEEKGLLDQRRSRALTEIGSGLMSPAHSRGEGSQRQLLGSPSLGDGSKHQLLRSPSSRQVPFPNNDMRVETIRYSDPFREHSAVNPDFDETFTSVSQNRLHRTVSSRNHPTRRPLPLTSATPAQQHQRRRSDLGTVWPQKSEGFRAMERVEQWVEAASKSPSAASTTTGSSLRLGRHDVVTL